MNLIAGHRRIVIAGLVCAVLSASTGIADECRIAFDMGSSGIRAGTSNSDATTRTNIDYLSPLLAGRGLEETVAPTIAALRDLPSKAGFPADCLRAGGGFSAWRLALQQDAKQLAETLARIRDESGVAVLVIPQSREGAYGYIGARQLLGERLTSNHVLDIGGGSLQIAGEHHSFGALFGQKLWHRRLCQALGRGDSMPCALQPLTPDELAQARALLQQHLAGIGRALPQGATLTAISRPVTRGVAPAVARFFNRPAGLDTLSPAMLRATLDQHAGLDLTETAQRLRAEKKHASYLISDLLLVEGLQQATGSHDLRVAEIDLTNLPGLLADERAYRWARHYGCYLERLSHQGVEAYDSNPATCPGR